MTTTDSMNSIDVVVVAVDAPSSLTTSFTAIVRTIVHLRRNTSLYIDITKKW